ncbi:OTU-like cysteine protease family protein [Prunus dulcis]|uniref:OTU-like cysteine protease family protein n=1 Tax=Prunus dulcis TaxID=3755 RepID=A0A4Y1S072_PRUDU|nr:OTU-like cysteine protease family protein [Prunus dulcis]
MGAWSMMEDVSLCEAWVQVSHCPVTGNEIKFSHMWKKIHQAFCERAIGSTRTEMALSSRWKVINKELGKWRNALAKAIDNHRSGENLNSEIIQAQMWFGATGQGKKILNETPLHVMPASDSPMDSPMSTDSPIENNPRPMGRKAAKAKRWSNSSKNASQFLEELSKHQAMRIEMDLKQHEHDMAVQVEYAKEREYVRKEREYVREQNIEKRDRETMAMDTSHMSPETKQFWKLERRDVMRRRLFRDDGPSHMDCQ